MADLNAFNNAEDEYLGDAWTAILCAVLAFFASWGVFVAATLAAQSVEVGVLLVWAVLAGSSVFAVLSVRWRPHAAGVACGFIPATLLLSFAFAVNGADEHREG